MGLWIAAVVVGLVLLVWGSDRFVVGAAVTARNLGVSPLVVGLTIVGFGTSAPEMLVSAVAAWDGSPGLGVGNALGSNITNIGLVIGVTALVAPVTVHSQTLRREFPLTLLVMALVWVLLRDDVLDRFDGLVLAGAFVVLVGAIVGIALRARRSDPIAGEYASEIPTGVSTPAALARVLIGLVVLLLGSRVVVWGAVHIARALDVSDLVIGLTVVAVGTSLPELAASVTSILKGESDIAVGNVLGSNMFNLLLVLGLPGIIAPGPVEPVAMQRDFPVTVALSLALFGLAFGFGNGGRIHRWEGGLLLGAFCCYEALLYFTA